MAKPEVGPSLCANNCADDAFHELAVAVPPVPLKMEEEAPLGESRGNASAVHGNAGGVGLEEEGSSSFGDSDGEGRIQCGRDSAEVNSPYQHHSGDGAPNGVSPLFMRKKVTDKWRKFISPQMWRYRWLQLRTKEILCQALKYEKELLSLQKAKGLQAEVADGKSIISKMNPSDSDGCEEIMKRRKRKKVEDMMDPSYMKKHHVFSYYENGGGLELENIVTDDFDRDIGGDGKSNFESRWLHGSKEKDFVMQQICLKDIIKSIDAAQSRVLALRQSLNSDILKEGKEMSLVERVNSSETVYCSKYEDEDQMSSDEPRTSSTISDRPEEEVILVDNRLQQINDTAESSIIKSRLGLLMGSDGLLSSSDQVGGYNQEVNSEGVLIDNAASKSRGYEQLGDISALNEHLETSAEEQTKSHESDDYSAPLSPDGEDSDNFMVTIVPRKVVRKKPPTGRPRGRPKRKRREILMSTLNQDDDVPLLSLLRAPPVDALKLRRKDEHATALKALQDTVSSVSASKLQSEDEDAAPVKTLPMSDLEKQGAMAPPTMLPSVGTSKLQYDDEDDAPVKTLRMADLEKRTAMAHPNTLPSVDTPKSQYDIENAAPVKTLPMSDIEKQGAVSTDASILQSEDEDAAPLKTLPMADLEKRGMMNPPNILPSAGASSLQYEDEDAAPVKTLPMADLDKRGVIPPNTLPSAGASKLQSEDEDPLKTLPMADSEKRDVMTPPTTLPSVDASKLQSEDEDAAPVKTFPMADLGKPGNGKIDRWDAAVALSPDSRWGKKPLLAYTSKRRKKVASGAPTQQPGTEVLPVASLEKQSCNAPSTSPAHDRVPSEVTSTPKTKRRQAKKFFMVTSSNGREKQKSPKMTPADDKLPFQVASMPQPKKRRRRTEKFFMVTSSSSRSGRIRKPKVY